MLKSNLTDLPTSPITPSVSDSSGVPENQAEIHAEAIAGLIDEQLATKKDLQILEANVTARIIRWVAGMLVAQAAIVATLVKLL